MRHYDQSTLGSGGDKMRIALDRESCIPLYRQIETYLRQAIGSGGLPPGARLPATRELAQDLGVSRLTVETAYAELRADGLVSARMGSGNYVLPPFRLVPVAGDAPRPDWPGWQRELPQRDWSFTTFGMRAALMAGGHANPIDLSGGVGDHRLFPVDDFRKAMQAVMRRDGVSAMEYGEQTGYAPLRRTFSDLLVSQGLYARADSILITAGSQQALGLVARLLAGPGDTVVVERPTYSGALHLFRMLGLRVLPVPVDERGMVVEALEQLLAGGDGVRLRPKLIYTMPTFHNPTGATLAGPRRAALVELAARHDIPILEDDYAGDLRFEGRAQPSLKAIDPGGRVIYTSTFAKMLAPGLRIGFLVADGPVFEHLAGLKQATDLATSNLVQRALEAYLTVGRYQEHLERSRRTYRKRRDVIFQAIREHMPAGTRVVAVPQGGLFVWVRLPGGVSATELLPRACRAGVAFMPGTAFYGTGPAVDAVDNADTDAAAEGNRYVRLNYAAQAPGEIAEGIRRLGQAVGPQEDHRGAA
jgi:GntR family transcriptional regulator/MocR family aminotransferase